MLIPTDYTPIQIIVTDDNQCSTIYNIWHNIYHTNIYDIDDIDNIDDIHYISHISLAIKYNLIYALIKTDKLNKIKYPYTTVPISSAGNIEFYKLNSACELVLKEENNIQEIGTFDGSRYWYKNGEIHRYNDLPAIIYHNGRQEWWRNGFKHRDNDLPALIHSNGTQEWYQHGYRHRDKGLPAIIRSDGTREWYRNGVKYDNPSSLYTNTNHHTR